MWSAWILLVLSLFGNPEFQYSNSKQTDCITSEEFKLFRMINEYRHSKGLLNVPLSARLSLVAQTHAQDLFEFYDLSNANSCNMHSWSDKGNWTACCYSPDHREAKCMWSKPQEIAGYDGDGYEIAFYDSGGANAEIALDGWKNSPSHNPVIINREIWKQVEWKAVGISIYKQYAVVWFGRISDPTESVMCSDNPG